MFDSRVERLGRRVLGKPENVAAADPGEATGPRDQQEAQRAHAAEQIGVGAFARAALGLGERVELEVSGEVVGEDAQLLPGAVGAVVVCRNDIEGELAFEFARVFSWAPRPHTKAKRAGRPKAMLVATA